MKPKNTSFSPLAARLRELRHAAKMTQQECAEHLQLRRSTYAYYETGAIHPPLSVLQRIATEYRVTMGYLLGEDLPAAPLAVRQESDPLDGARLLGECDREERLFLSLLRRMSEEDRASILQRCYEATLDNPDAQFDEHIHTTEE